MIDREIFAEELLRNGEEDLARMVAYGMDNSNCGTAAIRAMARAREEERARCAAIVQGKIDDLGEAGFEVDLVEIRQAIERGDE